jgi:hypothetical protein
MDEEAIGIIFVLYGEQSGAVHTPNGSRQAPSKKLLSIT